MEIYGPSRVESSEAVRGPQNTRAVDLSEAAESVSQADQIDISPAAEMVSRVGDLPEIRTDLVAEIREQIQLGTYETDEKLDTAIGRLLDEIG